MSRASGVRNLLVHQYSDIDDAQVVGFLGRIDDLERFVQQVLVWIDPGKGSPVRS
jgi:uncharacterized protein YutE (UPF0331/DUF86 family)